MLQCYSLTEIPAVAAPGGGMSGTLQKITRTVITHVQREAALER